MKAYHELPEGYTKTRSIDLQKDKKTMLLVNGIALAIMILMVAVMGFFVPILSMVDLDNGDRGLVDTLIRLAVMFIGCIVYIVLHELVHAAVMKAVGCKKVRFGFTGVYAYAGSPGEYFDRSAYICVSLAPLVVFGLIFLVLQFVVPRTWFWVVWVLQISNVSGAAGDIYVSILTARSHKTILAEDTGVGMAFFDRTLE